MLNLIVLQTVFYSTEFMLCFRKVKYYSIKAFNEEFNCNVAYHYDIANLLDQSNAMDDLCSLGKSTLGGDRTEIVVGNMFTTVLVSYKIFNCKLSGEIENI